MEKRGPKPYPDRLSNKSVTRDLPPNDEKWGTGVVWSNSLTMRAGAFPIAGSTIRGQGRGRGGGGAAGPVEGRPRLVAEQLLQRRPGCGEGTSRSNHDAKRNKTLVVGSERMCLVIIRKPGPTARHGTARM